MFPIDRAKKILKEKFGYSDFRLKQKEIIESVLSGNDTLAIMPTGGGKSMCYQLPALCLDGVTLVVSPLISLMQDQVLGLKDYGVSAGYLNSAQTSDERDEVLNRIQAGTIKLLYVAPERILSESLLQSIEGLKVSLIAIDEAHCVSQWGHEFRSDYRRLHILKDKFPQATTVALTATADEKTRQDIVEQLHLNHPKEFLSSFDRPNIRYSILERENEIKQLHKFIQEFHAGDTGIVYCLSRKKVERVTESLCDLGYKAFAYHAGLSGRERQNTQILFDREDQVIIVATIAFGMGIDRPDVRFVAHLDLPKSIEGYYQETGRAGRDGLPANAWMIYGLADVVKLSSMIEMTEAQEAYKRISRQKLNSMLALCEATECRRQILLKYFGEVATKPCGNCDVCLEPAELKDASVEAQKLLSAIYRTGQFFGSAHVIDVLRGSQSEKIIDKNHHNLSVYGIGKETSKSEWNRIVRQLLNQGYIKIKNWEYRNLVLTEKARPLLRGEESFFIRKRALVSSAKSKRKTIPTKDFAAHGREDLFEDLRLLRLELAKESGLPPYMVFSDKTLHDMCSLLPENKDQMMMVHGVGESKWQKYGHEFLAKIPKR